MSHSTVFSHLWNCRSAYHLQNRSHWPLQPATAWPRHRRILRLQSPNLGDERLRDGPARLAFVLNIWAGPKGRTTPVPTSLFGPGPMCISAPRKHKIRGKKKRGKEKGRNSPPFLAPLPPPPPPRWASRWVKGFRVPAHLSEFQVDLPAVAVSWRID
jgi:hypothetical protein